MSEMERSVNGQPPGADDARKSTYYLMAGFLLSWFPVPISGLAVLPLVASFVYALRHIAALKRAGAPKPVRNSAVVGVCLTFMLVGFVLAPVVQYVTTLDYQRCMWGANTRQAVAACGQDNHENPGSIAKFFLE